MTADRAPKTQLLTTRPGGVIKDLPQLVDQIDQGVRRGALPAATKSLQVVRAKLGNDAGVVGAAILALHTFKNED